MKFAVKNGTIDTEINHLTIAGWTGRDKRAVDHHIAELKEIGVAPPSDVPLFYRASAGLATQADEIEVLGAQTSGEIEPLVLNAQGQLWLGLASDHTDRALEAASVAASKQICAKPIGRALWPLPEADALDGVELRCEALISGAWSLYQEGTLAEIRPLAELIEKADLPEGGAMLCGTLPAIGGVRPSEAYRMRLTDPSSGKSLSLDYKVQTLPVIA